ncbi:MAG: hypothetical protein V7751_09805 [Pseudoalteromonas distincta]
MKNLEPIAKKHGFSVITKCAQPSIKALLKKRSYLKAIASIAQTLHNRLSFKLASFLIKNSKIIFIHPQTAGFRTLFRLSRKNEVYLYVMDNSFFCIRSYNYHPVLKKECLQCVGNSANADLACLPFPIKINRNSNLKLLGEMAKIAHHVTFLCQNHNQSLLLKEHFGATIKTEQIGMNTGELAEWSQSNLKFNKRTNRSNPFILFHGAISEPKGLNYFIQLANEMPSWNFIIPAHESALYNFALPSNIELRDVKWSTGLRELVQEAILVLNPSMWSAPIEGALIKSLAYNLNVGTVCTLRGFESEVPQDVGILRLPLNVTEAAAKIEVYLEGKKDFAMFLDGRTEWIKAMKASNDFEVFISEL